MAAPDWIPAAIISCQFSPRASHDSSQFWGFHGRLGYRQFESWTWLHFDFLCEVQGCRRMHEDR